MPRIKSFIDTGHDGLWAMAAFSSEPHRVF